MILRIMSLLVCDYVFVQQSKRGGYWNAKASEEGGVRRKEEQNGGEMEVRSDRERQTE